MPYVLAYSSGYEQSGTIDRIEICDGGVEDIFGDGSALIPSNDTITFFDGSNEIYEAIDHDGGWYAGPIATDLDVATLDTTEADLFERTHYWGDWGTWGTYHYDYVSPQAHTIVTRSTTALTLQSTVTAVFDFT